MEPLLVVVVAIVAAIGGAVAGFFLRNLWASQTMQSATAEARRIEAEARTRQKELILEAKDEKLRTVQIGLKQLQQSSIDQVNITFAGAIIAVIPLAQLRAQEHQFDQGAADGLAGEPTA